LDGHLGRLFYYPGLSRRKPLLRTGHQLTRRAHKQRWCSPLDGIGHCGANGLACFGDRYIDGHPQGQGFIEGLEQLNCCLVSNLVRHGQHSRHTLPHQAGGGAGEDVTERSLIIPSAGIQQRYAQGSMVSQQPGQVGCAQRAGLALLTGRGREALIAGPIRPGVPAGRTGLAEEVEYMPGTALHRLLQVMPALTLQPGKLRQPPPL
jgi:hypothetical protein